MGFVRFVLRISRGLKVDRELTDDGPNERRELPFSEPEVLSLTEH